MAEIAVDRGVARDVAHIERMVKGLAAEVGSISRGVDSVGREVTAVSVAQQRTMSDLAQLREDFLQFARASERRDAVQRAEIRIGVLQDQLDHDFGHHKVVRRSATGLLQAFDVGLVSEEAVQAVSEQLMIQTPRYWLSPALVALSAWSADDRDLCDRAVAEAYRRSPSKTALLFTLVLRRQGRVESSTRWLKHYLDAQDPAALGRNFAVILESVANGAFGPGGRAVVERSLTAWREALSDDASHDRQVQRWRTEVESHRPTPAKAHFPALAAVSPQWPRLGACLSGAEANAPLLEKYRAMMAEEIEPPDRLEDALDDILDRLVKEYDDEELPIQRDLAFNHAVIVRDGDVTAAQADAEQATAALETTLDYLSIQTGSALEPASIGVSRATQRIAVASCRDWFARGHEQATSAYRAQLPADVEVEFDTSHNLGARTFQLPPWKGPLSAGVPTLEASLGAHWDRTIEAYVQSLAYPVKQKAIVPGVVTVLVALIFLNINIVGGLLLTLLAAGIGALIVNNGYQHSLKAQQQARQQLGTWRQESITQLRAAGADLVRWGERFQAADQQADEARAFITALGTAEHASTPWERRTIEPEGALA